MVDEYGVKVGTTYQELKSKRPNCMQIHEWHLNIYLYQDESNISYKMSYPEDGYGRYGPDGERRHTLEDMKDSHVIAIIWD